MDLETCNAASTCQIPTTWRLAYEISMRELANRCNSKGIVSLPPLQWIYVFLLRVSSSLQLQYNLSLQGAECSSNWKNLHFQLLNYNASYLYYWLSGRTSSEWVGIFKHWHDMDDQQLEITILSISFIVCHITSSIQISTSRSVQRSLGPLPCAGWGWTSSLDQQGSTPQPSWPPMCHRFKPFKPN